MAKRKVDSVNRAFQHRWVTEYMFTDIAGKSVCLIYGANVAVIKEFNLRQHYETKHQDKLKNLNAEQKLQKVEELKKNLTFQQTFFHQSKITKRQPNQPGTTMKSCMMKVCDVLCPDKTHFIRGVEILDIKSIITNVKLPWDKLVGLTTDGAPVLCSEKSGLVSRMRLTAYHCITHQERLCGKILKMEHVMITVTLNHRQFQSFMWEIDSEFTDIPHHTEVPQQGNLSVHGHGMYDAVKAFQVKLSQMHQSNLPHFPCCQVMLNQVGLQCNDTLEEKYDTKWPAQFISSIPEAMPQLRLHAAPTLCMLSFIFSGVFGSMFIFLTCIILTGYIFMKSKIFKVKVNFFKRWTSCCLLESSNLQQVSGATLLCWLRKRIARYVFASTSGTSIPYQNLTLTRCHALTISLSVWGRQNI
uniref:SPIN-DOC-like zinc-finger domain-containing protein n=1 Tax=Maylandia zebra TaxID=106582 RepID=A0A3P9CFD4_9CICH